MDDNDFPCCKPHWLSIHKMNSDDFRIRYKALRSVSDSFISRSGVRQMILKKSGHKCYLCGAKDHLQIDHMISVYQGAKEKISYREINSYKNLMAVCRTCNAGKLVVQEVIWQVDQNKE